MKLKLVAFIFLLLLESVYSLAKSQANGPLKVFILCGQSNMEGHAKISTFEAVRFF